MAFSARAPAVQASEEMLKEQASGFSIRLSATPSIMSHCWITLAWIKLRTDSGRNVALVCIMSLSEGRRPDG